MYEASSKRGYVIPPSPVLVVAGFGYGIRRGCTVMLLDMAWLAVFAAYSLSADDDEPT